MSDPKISAEVDALTACLGALSRVDLKAWHRIVSFLSSYAADLKDDEASGLAPEEGPTE